MRGVCEELGITIEVAAIQDAFVFVGVIHYTLTLQTESLGMDALLDCEVKSTIVWQPWGTLEYGSYVSSPSSAPPCRKNRR